MKKKGFTLVELLAVITILAIIALITVPIVLRLVNNSREESRKQSLKLYSEAVQNSIYNYQVTSHNRIAGTFTASNGGHTLTSTDSDVVLTVDFKNSKVVCESIVLEPNGEIKFNSCKVGNSDKLYSYSTSDEEVKVVE